MEELALAEWPGEWDVWTRQRLVDAWVRRKRFEARLVAMELAMVLAPVTGARRAGPERVSSDALLGMMGVTGGGSAG